MSIACLKHLLKVKELLSFQKQLVNLYSTIATQNHTTASQQTYRTSNIRARSVIVLATAAMTEGFLSRSSSSLLRKSHRMGFPTIWIIPVLTRTLYVMYFNEKVAHSVHISSPRVVSKSCLIHCFLSPPLQEQIQIHRRYSILENLFMQPHQTELSTYKRENRIHAKTSTLKLKILWPTDHNLVTCSKTKKIH